MNEQNYFTQFSGELVGVQDIEDRVTLAGFKVLSVDEHEYGWWVKVVSLNVNMNGTPQADLEKRVRRVGLELNGWGDNPDVIVVEIRE